VDLGFFDQHLDRVTDANTVEAEFRQMDPSMTDGECRGQLARFGFFADDLDKKVGQLSGGERNRLSLLKLVYEKSNFLVLDEPTNHLDIPATESLEEALDAYGGTLIVVSHDRVFLDRIADRIIRIENGEVTDYPGTFAEFREHEARSSQPSAAGIEPEGDGGPWATGNGRRAADVGSKGFWSKNRLAKRRRELEELERSIAAAASERDTIEARLSGALLSEGEVRDLAWRHAELLETLERREARWERWAEELEEQEALRDG